METPGKTSPPPEREGGEVGKEDLEREELEKRLGRGQDGSDSGVELNGGAVAEVASCDSSLISCCYSTEDLLGQTLQLADERELGDGTSEGGSESSSVTSSKPPNSARRKCGGAGGLVGRSPRPTQSSRSRTPLKERSLSRTPGGGSQAQAKAGTPKTPVSSLSRSLSLKSPAPEQPKPRLSSRVKSPMVSNSVSDGRWPSSVSKHQPPPKNKMKDLKTSPMSVSIGPMEGKSCPLDKYATLPRRRRKSAENLAEVRTLRDPSLNRTASLRRKKNQEGSPHVNGKSMPPYPSKAKAKTRIYHETSVQTALTAHDIESAFAGQPVQDVHNRVETKSASIQVNYLIIK
jgi:hypothetical protein